MGSIGWVLARSAFSYLRIIQLSPEKTSYPWGLLAGSGFGYIRNQKNDSLVHCFIVLTTTIYVRVILFFLIRIKRINGAL